jgi:1-deoxyxylulose-5-phosphate synthase
MKRRDFIKTTTAAGLGLATLPFASLPLQAAQKRFTAFDKVALPHTGFKVTRLATGSGSRGSKGESNQTRIGMPAFETIIRHAYDRGLNFWDMADMYGSHEYYGKCLKFIPREKVAILTKTINRDAAGVKADIERFRKEIGTDYIDVLLFHVLQDGDWPETMKATMDVVSEAREKGIIGTFGCSCHSIEALQAAVESPWTEYILARINHAGNRMDGTPDEIAAVLRKGHEKGKFIMGMKILGMGDLMPEVNKSLEFVLDQGFINSFTIGFESAVQLDEIIEKIAEVRV